MDPNCKILKEGNKKGKGLEVEIFGIKVFIDEGSSEGFLPIKKMAEKTHTSTEFIEEILKKHELMSEDGSSWSEVEYGVNNCVRDSDYIGSLNKMPIGSIIMHRIYTTPKGKELKDCNNEDLIDLGLHVHEQFVLELMKMDR